MPFATKQLDLEIITLSEVGQTKTKIIYHLYVETKKKIHMKLIIKQKQTHKHGKQTYSYQSEWWEKEIVWRFGFGICTILFMEWMVNGDQLYNRGNTT